MKKFASVLAMVSICAQSAFAGGSETIFTTAEEFEAVHQTYEVEAGAMSQADLQPLLAGEAEKSRDGDIIAGIIIGGIIGAIAADALDRQNDRYDRDHYRPGRPNRPGQPGRPGYGRPPVRQVACYAQNARGEVFRSIAQRAQPAQDSAMRKCFQYSRDRKSVV